LIQSVNADKDNSRTVVLNSQRAREKEAGKKGKLETLGIGSEVKELARAPGERHARGVRSNPCMQTKTKTIPRTIVMNSQRPVN